MNAYQKYFPEELKLFEEKIIVYLVYLNLFEPDEFICFLSEDERVRADKLKIDKKKKQYVVTRGILRRLISSSLLKTGPEEIQFSYGEHGKPYINYKYYNKPIEFNLSHSGDYVLIAITLGHQLGVDIEEMNPVIDYQSLSKRFFSEEEISNLNNLEQAVRQDAFYRCWARKESFIKAEGSGVSFGLDRFTVSLDEDSKITQIKINNTESDYGSWFNYKSVTVPRYKTAIASNTNGLQIVTHVIAN